MDAISNKEGSVLSMYEMGPSRNEDQQVILEYDQTREEQLHILFTHVEEPEHCLNCQCVMNEGPNPRSVRTSVPCGH